MTYGENKILRLRRHDAPVDRPATHDHGARVMDLHRSRRTRDQARKVWYAYYRQVRFARWLGFVKLEDDLIQAYRNLAIPD